MPALLRYAWSVLTYTVVVILSGAVVRATGSGAGCGPSWPGCHGQVAPPLEGSTAIEFGHRVLSGLALAAVLVLAVLVWRRMERGHPARTGTLLSVIAIVIESLIGAMIVLAEWVGDDASLARVVAVPLHLVNTFFLLAALTLTVFWLSGGRRLDRKANPRLFRMVLAGGIALVLIASSGAVTALANTLFPEQFLSADITDEEHFLTGLRIVHPILAVLAASLGWWTWGRAGLRRARMVRVLPTLVATLMATGALNVVLGGPLWMQLIHLALADALWITGVLVAAEGLQARQPEPAV